MCPALFIQNVSIEDRVEFSWPPRAAAMTFPWNRLHCSNLLARGLEDHMAEAWQCFSASSYQCLFHQHFFSAQFRILFWIVVYLMLRINRKSLLAFEYSNITLGVELLNSRVTVTSWCPTSSGSCSPQESWEIYPFERTLVTRYQN